VNEPQERQIHLIDYWRVLVKRQWVIFTALTVVVATVALGSLMQIPIYTATTRLQIEQNTPNVQPFQEVLSTVPNNYRDDYYQTQYGLIQSRSVARDVIESLDLARHAEFDFAAPDEARPGLTPEEMLLAMRVNVLLGGVTVTPVRNSRLVDVSYSSADPALAAAVANRVAETYIAFNSELRYNTSTRATTSLAHQIANLQEQIDTREKELQAYAKEHGIIALSEKQDISLKNLNDLNDSYTRARAERIEKEARYSALRNSGPGDLTEVLQSQTIKELSTNLAGLTGRRAQLSQKYKPDWPEMMRLDHEIDEAQVRLDSERRNVYDQVLGAAESAYRSARSEEAQLKQAREDQTLQVQEFSVKEIGYTNLKAEISNKRTTLDALLKRQAETGSAAGLSDIAAGNLRIIDPAEVPASASSPRTLRNIMLAIITGLFLGVGLAFFFDYMDRSVKSTEEMHQASGVPSVGLIPVYRASRGRLRVIRGAMGNGAAGSGIELIAHEDSQSVISEAFREVRTALLVSQAGGPPRKILVTSAHPGEGKTSVTVNLAITLAQSGHRVLLVDADLRKPRLHSILSCSNDRGLSNYLADAGTPWPEPVATHIDNLFLIPSGPLPPNPADLLDSERFMAVQKEMEAQGFDQIIYDSPPVLAVADPAIIAGRADAVVIVAHAGVTPRDGLGHAVARLRRVTTRIVGGVLNRADRDLQTSYYDDAYRRYDSETARRSPTPDKKRDAAEKSVTI
jgi:capsular exopolysaccharide synthesis family protein